MYGLEGGNLEKMYDRYKAAPGPKKGQRVIGWWIKERYRMMRGYKRLESIRNVVTLTARMGVRSGRYDMTELYI